MIEQIEELVPLEIIDVTAYEERQSRNRVKAGNRYRHYTGKEVEVTKLDF
jgi:hypothetical protein